MIVVLMGVSGVGKTTIGTLLAERSGAVFADADDYHPPANKTKMAAGRALDDGDRQPWLKTLNQLMRQWERDAQQGVLACSALRQKYREALVEGLKPNTARVVLLEGSRDLIARRLAAREHAYMNPALLDSQIKTLEPPDDALTIVNDREPQKIVDLILSHIKF